MGFLSQIRRFDAYTKPVEDFRERTVTGAVITICCSLLCMLLFFSELNYYLTTEVVSELRVDNTRGGKLVMNLDLTVAGLPCNYFSIDAMDLTGDRADAEHQLFKVRMKDGQEVALSEKVEEINAEKLHDEKQDDEEEPEEEETGLAVKDECQSCYGAETEEQPCCNSCEEVQQAYRNKGWAFDHSAQQFSQCVNEHFDLNEELQKTEGESCRVHGHLEVNRVSGSLQISPGKTLVLDGSVVHDIRGMKHMSFDTSHTIHHLSFGEVFPGQENPLDNTEHEAESMNMAWHYNFKVIPTEFRKLDGSRTATNQFSVTRHEKALSQMSSRLPGINFHFEIAPIAVIKMETRRSAVHFATSVCAIIGGVWTISSILDSFIHKTNKLLIKTELGKAG